MAKRIFCQKTLVNSPREIFNGLVILVFCNCSRFYNFFANTDENTHVHVVRSDALLHYWQADKHTWMTFVLSFSVKKQHLLTPDRETQKDVNNFTKVQLGKPKCLLGLLTYKSMEDLKAASAPRYSIPCIGDSSQQLYTCCLMPEVQIASQITEPLPGFQGSEGVSSLQQLFNTSIIWERASCCFKVTRVYKIIQLHSLDS